MRVKVYGKKLTIKWWTPNGPEGSIDVTEEYQNRGGTITEETEAEISSYFPTESYKNTALTNNMPDDYKCGGSISTSFFQPGQEKDVIAVSDYFDLTGHIKELGDHHNVYRQWEVKDNIGHEGGFEGRHIKLDKKLSFGVYLDNEKIYEDYVKANLP